MATTRDPASSSLISSGALGSYSGFPLGTGTSLGSGTSRGISTKFASTRGTGMNTLSHLLGIGKNLTLEMLLGPVSKGGIF